MKYRKWVRCKCQIYIRDLTFSADPDETTIHVYVCGQQKNNLQVRTRTLGICHKMSFDCFHFLFNMEQVDKKRKILSDISNTHDKHIKRSDNHRYWWCSPLSSQSQWELCQPRDGCSYPDDRGLWSHLKDFLPSRGMKSRDLGSSLGWFMWTRFCSQRKLDVFVHFLKSAAEVRPPSHFSRLPTADMKTLIKAITVNSDEDFTWCKLFWIQVQWILCLYTMNWKINCTFSTLLIILTKSD